MTSAVLENLDGKINSIATDTTSTKLNQQEHERILQLNLKDVYDKQKEKSLGGAMAARRGPVPASERENMMMDVDEPDNKGKNRKYVIPCLFFVFAEIFIDWRASQEATPKPSRKRNKFWSSNLSYSVLKLYHFPAKNPFPLVRSDSK